MEVWVAVNVIDINVRVTRRKGGVRKAVFYTHMMACVVKTKGSELL